MYSFSFTTRLAGLVNKVYPTNAPVYTALGAFTTIRDNFCKNKDLVGLKENLSHLKKELDDVLIDPEYLGYSEIVQITIRYINNIEEKLSTITRPAHLNIGFIEDVVKPIEQSMQDLQKRLVKPNSYNPIKISVKV